MNISDVTVDISEHNDTAAVSCKTKDARYHIWVNKNTRNFIAGDDTSGVIYKNSLVEHGKPGYFSTRHLKSSSKFGRTLVVFLLERAGAERAFEKAEAKLAERIAARMRQVEEHKRRLIRERAAPEMFSALEAIEAVEPDDSGVREITPSVMDMIHKALAKARGKK